MQSSNHQSISLWLPRVADHVRTMSSSSSTADAAPHPARGDDGELYLFEIAMAPAAFAGHWTGSWEPCRDAGANGGIVDVHAPSEPMDVITEKSQRGVRHFYGVMPHLLRLRQYHNVRGGEIELAAKLVEGAQAWITLPASGDSYVEISPGGVGDRRSTVFFPNELDRSAEKVDNGKLLRAVASLAARRREEMGAGMSAAAPAASVKGSARKKQEGLLSLSPLSLVGRCCHDESPSLGDAGVLQLHRCRLPASARRKPGRCPHAAAESPSAPCLRICAWHCWQPHGC